MRDDSDLDTKHKQQRDFDDLQNESAGRETGRIRRFLTGEAQTPEEIRKKRARQVLRSLLDILLEDPIYRAKFDEATEAVANAMGAVERVLADLAIRIEAAEDQLTEMQARAARLPDGTRVYRDASGVVRRGDGAAVDDTLAATILWTGNEPSYEERNQARDALEHLQTQLEDVTTYRDDVLGPAQDHMNDSEDPPSMEELDRILKDVADRMPKAVQNELDGDVAAAPAAMRSAAIKLPTIGGD